MRIPTLAVTMVAAAAAVVALPTVANAADPVAVDDTVQTTREAPATVDVLANDTVDVGKSLTVTTTTPTAAHGTVACTSAGDCTYTPENDWVGTDTFTYGVTDDTATDTGQVSITTVEISNITLGFTPANLIYSNDAAATNTVTASGTVTKSGGVALQGVEVELWNRPTGTTVWSLVGEDVSSALGKVKFADLAPTSRTSYQWRAAGGETSSTRSVAVTPTLTADYSSKKSAVGTPLTISGESTPATEGAEVRLERRDATGNWVLVQSAVFGTPDEAHTATYSFSVAQPVSGSTVYRVVVPAANGRMEAVSGQTAVKVYDAEVTHVEPTNTDEWVTIKNTGNISLNLSGWKLSDNNSTVVLPNRTVAVDSIVRIHTGKGVNDSKDVYLKRTDRLWADTGTVTLTDKNETELDSFTYPAVVGP